MRELEPGRRHRRVEGDQRASVRERNQPDAGAVLERARRVDDDHGAAAEGGELRRRVRLAGDLRLRQPHDRAAQIVVDVGECGEDMLGERERDRARRAEELAGPAAARRDLANLRYHFY